MKIYSFFIMFLLPVIIFSQDLKPNKKIKSNVDFGHAVSGMIAPLKLEDFSRTALFTNSKNDSVFSAEYENKNNDILFKFKIIPALLNEERLLNHYYKDLNERKYTPKESEKVNKRVVLKEGKFKLHGINTYFNHLDRLINVRVYDAGFWVFISEVSQKGSDTLALDKIQEKFLDNLQPVKIVEKNPLTRYSDIHYAKAAFRDTLMLRSTMSSAMNKLKWIYENIDKYERASGIPGTFLDYQLAGINGFINYTTDTNPKPSKGGTETNKLISFFTKLQNDGFADEFLMEQYYYLLTPPENHQFDYQGYQKWKLENTIDYNVYHKYYIIVNSRKKTDLSKDE